MADLRSEYPMHLMAATYNAAAQEVRFLFYYPDEENPEDWKHGIGAVLLVSHPTIRVPGDDENDERVIDLSFLPDYTDKLTGNRGLPCGLGFSKCDCQIVDFDGPDWMFHITAQSYGYCGNVKLDVKDVPNDEEES